MDTSATAAMQQAVAQAAMAAAAAAASSTSTSQVTTSVTDGTHQIFLQASAPTTDGNETTLQVEEIEEAEEISLEGATSEQAAIKMVGQVDVNWSFIVISKWWFKI